MVWSTKKIIQNLLRHFLSIFGEKDLGIFSISIIGNGGNEFNAEKCRVLLQKLQLYML